MLESIWFILWGLLWAVYFMLDGFDLGVGTLLPFVAKNEEEKRLLFNSTGPFWDGNEVWLITAGGVTFAAFPGTYAVMFSALYSPLMLILFALILRGVSWEFRGKVDHPAWRRTWDFCQFIGSFLPALLFGVAFANIFQGIPIDKQGVYQGTLFSLLNPYGLLGGALFLLLFLVHGSLWLAVRTEGAVSERGQNMAKKLWPVLVVVAVLFLVFTAVATNLYDNYLSSFFLWLIPLLAVAALFANRFFMAKGAWWKAWIASAGTIVFCTFFGVAGLYPYLLPSSLDPAFGMSIHNSASSTLTLQIMLGVALVMVPVVIMYQAWVYNFFKTKISPEDLSLGDWY
jgi:cytochrome d ubiquinol oxidase subunit II